MVAHVFFLLHVFIQAVKIISSVDQLLVYLLMLWRADDGLFLADSCFLHLPMRTGCLTTQYLLLISILESLTRLAAQTTAGREGNGLFFQESWCFWKVVVLTAGNLTLPACFYSNTVRNTNKMHCTRLSPSSAPPSIRLAASTRLRLFSVLPLRQLSCAERLLLSPPPAPSAENKENIY